ncbi:PcfJ-like protein [Bacillus phage vB_BceH_LY2]|nr:PcfJ-like protein [Bacillus phage vB_BceH_LY2]
MSKKKNEVLDMIRDGELELTETIGHVNYYMIEKTGYSFHFYATYKNDNGNLVLVEMLYDLRNKKYYIKKNDREVRFNIRNVDLVVPRYKEGYRNYEFYTSDGAKKFFDMVSVEENKGMYEKMTDVIGAFGEEVVNMSSRALIRLITEYNKLELVYKAGIDIHYAKNSWFRTKVYQASKEEGKNKIHDIFGVTKSQLKFVKEFGESGRHVSYFMNCCIKVPDITQQEMDTYRGAIRTIKELEEKYQLEGRLRRYMNHTGVGEYIDIVSCTKKGTNHYRNNDFWAFVVKPRNTIHSLPKLIEYLLFECYVSQGMEFSEALTNYRDYYEMSVDIGYERFEKYPKFLKTYHDVVARNYKLMEDDVLKKKFEDEREKFRKLECKMKKFSVIAPQTMSDIVAEGNSQNHCCASYSGKVAKGQTIILFLRKTEDLDKSLVTLEVQGNSIVQARGFANRSMDAGEREALNTYAKKMSMVVNC